MPETGPSGQAVVRGRRFPQNQEVERREMPA
jgi:hypothetical protein